jgi:hypothetical protein
MRRRGPQSKQLSVAGAARDVSAAELDALVVPRRESEVWLDPQAIAGRCGSSTRAADTSQAEAVEAPTFRMRMPALRLTRRSPVAACRRADRGVDPARLTGAQDALGLSIGAPFAASASADASRRLKAFYMGLGYRNAAVTHEMTTSKDGSVSLAWAVKEGPRYLVKDVNVVGAETTNAGLVQKAITLEPGACHEPGRRRHDAPQSMTSGRFRRVISILEIRLLVRTQANCHRR